MRSKPVTDPQDPFDDHFDTVRDAFASRVPQHGRAAGQDAGDPLVGTSVKTLETYISSAAASTAGTGPNSTVAVTSGGITINLLFDAAAMAAPVSFRAGVQQAVSLLTAAIADPITVNIKIDYSGTGGGAAAGPDNGLYESYSWVKTSLINHATPGDATFNAMPGGTSVQGQSNVAVWNAQLKLWGVLGANDTTTDDGGATFATDINPNLLVGVALHELSHAMGRVPYGPQPDIFDLFRLTSPGGWLFDGNTPATAAYFSLDGGKTKLADYGQTSDTSDFLNSGAQGPNDPFNEFYSGSTVQQLSSVDLKQLDALGFHLAANLPNLSVFPAPIDPSNTLFVDLNGDGKVDLVEFYQGREMAALSDGTKFGQWAEWTSGATPADKFADVNGDGKPDLVQFYNGRELVAVSDGTKFGPWTDWATGATAEDNLVDVNGDGKADLVQFYNGREMVALSDGTKFKSWTEWASGATATDKLVDVNGDSKDDLVQFYNGRELVSLSESTKFGPWTDWASGATAADKLVDVNGDGNADLVQFYNGREMVALSDGAKFKPWTEWAAGATATDKLVDVNGDGKPDLVQFYNGREVVALSDGSKFGRWSDWTNGATVNDAFVDLNGDGKTDIFQFKNGDAYAALSTGSSFGPWHLWGSAPAAAATRSQIEPQANSAALSHAVEPISSAQAGDHLDQGVSPWGTDHHLSNGFFFT